MMRSGERDPDEARCPSRPLPPHFLFILTVLSIKTKGALPVFISKVDKKG